MTVATGLQTLAGRKRHVALAAFTLCACSLAASAGAATWRVGPERHIRTVAEAAKRAQPGDIVEIDPGVYANDFAVWRRDDVTVRGLGGGAHMRATKPIPNGKAIWITLGENLVIENVEFSGARVRDGNGAGIRQERGGLTLRNTYFHDNQFGVMTANREDLELAIEDSRFARHRRDDGIAHGIYAGTIARFTLTGSHVTGTEGGHHVKSRALENHILYNRLEDSADMRTSRIIDLSNCGLSFVIGNELLQGKTTRNVNAIGYGPEGCANRPGSNKRLFVVHNTLVNESFNGVFVRNHEAAQVLVGNNLLLGSGRFLSGEGRTVNNARQGPDPQRQAGWLPRETDAIIDAATPLPGPRGAPLVARREFRAPAGTVARPEDGAPDIGALEVGKK